MTTDSTARQLATDESRPPYVTDMPRQLDLDFIHLSVRSEHVVYVRMQIKPIGSIRPNAVHVGVLNAMSWDLRSATVARALASPAMFTVSMS